MCRLDCNGSFCLSTTPYLSICSSLRFSAVNDVCDTQSKIFQIISTILITPTHISGHHDTDTLELKEGKVGRWHVGAGTLDKWLKSGFSYSVHIWLDPTIYVMIITSEIIK